MPLVVRGEGGDQVQFMVDGMSMTSGINNDPFTGVSYTAVQEMQVQTGGFNVEYGNVRSGLVNVVTKEPERNRYTFDASVRYSPASSTLSIAGTDVDGSDVAGPDSRRTFELRPLFDEEVALEGVGSWPSWKQSSARLP